MGQLLFKPHRMKIIIFSAILSVALCANIPEPDLEAKQDKPPGIGEIGCFIGPCTVNPSSSDNDPTTAKPTPAPASDNKCNNHCSSNEDCRGSAGNKCTKCIDVGFGKVCGF